uniref:Uncharacterized protein n=1 Tax=Sphaerodactylus townsendi TaxID=933632 RepID=A0ACB8F871_9SAUR
MLVSPEAGRVNAVFEMVLLHFYRLFGEHSVNKQTLSFKIRQHSVFHTFPFYTLCGEHRKANPLTPFLSHSLESLFHQGHPQKSCTSTNTVFTCSFGEHCVNKQTLSFKISQHSVF